MNSFEKELSRFRQMFGSNGTFLSNVQVRAARARRVEAARCPHPGRGPYPPRWQRQAGRSCRLSGAVPAQALAGHADRSAQLEAQVQQLLHTLGQQQSRRDLRALVDAVDSVKHRIALLEASGQRLGTCGEPRPSRDSPGCRRV